MILGLALYQQMSSLLCIKAIDRRKIFTIGPSSRYVLLLFATFHASHRVINESISRDLDSVISGKDWGQSRSIVHMQQLPSVVHPCLER